MNIDQRQSSGSTSKPTCSQKAIPSLFSLLTIASMRISPELNHPV